MRKHLARIFSEDTRLAFQHFTTIAVATFVLFCSLGYSAFLLGWLPGLLIGLIPAILFAAACAFIARRVWYVALPVFLFCYFGVIFLILTFARTGEWWL